MFQSGAYRLHCGMGECFGGESVFLGREGTVIVPKSRWLVVHFDFVMLWTDCCIQARSSCCCTLFIMVEFIRFGFYGETGALQGGSSLPMYTRQA